MKVSSIVRESSIDFPGRYGPVVFLGGCNYECGFCHNSRLTEKAIGEKAFESFMKNVGIKAEVGWYDGVTISGGEPTLNLGLIGLARRFKQMGLAVKLDTNGSNFAVLESVLKEGIIDYVAMDVKGPFRLYNFLTGMEHVDGRDGLFKGMCLVTQFPDYEFRTTVVPFQRENGEISFLTAEEIGETAKMIAGWTGANEHKYFLQGFLPVRGQLLDNQLEEMPETSKELLAEAMERAREHLPMCNIR